MQLCGDQLFRQGLTGIDVIWVLHLESELYWRGVPGCNHNFAGGNKVNKDAPLLRRVLVLGCAALIETPVMKYTHKATKASR